MIKYYGYYLIDPNTNEVRYIGITSRPTKRFNEHIHSAKHKKSHKDKWILILLKKNQSPIYKIVFESESKEEVILFEKESILNHNNLTNSTNGGEYFNFTNDVIEKIREKNKGKNNPCYNRIWSDDEKMKLRLSKKNRKEVIINGIKYDSINQAAEMLHIRFYNARKFVTKQ